MFPPTILCKAAPTLPTMLRERTTMPRTMPRLRVMRCPGSSNAVVTIVVEMLGIRSLHEEVDAHVDAPLFDTTVVVGVHFDFVDPCAPDFLDAAAGFLQSASHGVLDAFRRRRTDFDDFCDGMHGCPPKWTGLV